MEDRGLRGDVDFCVGDETRIGSDELRQGFGGGILRLMRANGSECVAGIGVDEPEPNSVAASCGARRELPGQTNEEWEIAVGDGAVGGDEDGDDILRIVRGYRGHVMAIDIFTVDECVFCAGV